MTTRYALPLARLETRDDDDAAVSAVSRRCPAARTGTRGTERRTRDGDASDGRNAVRSARAGRAYSAASWYFLILAILAWCPRGARPPTRDRRPPASSVHGRSFELPQAGHTAPQCADRASARIVYRFAADPPRAAAVAEDRGSGIFRLGVGHCARLLPRVHAFPEITELTSDVDVTTRVDGRRRSIPYVPRVPRRRLERRLVRRALVGPHLPHGRQREQLHRFPRREEPLITFLSFPIFPLSFVTEESRELCGAPGAGTPALIKSLTPPTETP